MANTYTAGKFKYVKTHGMTGTRVHKAWIAMHDRCARRVGNYRDVRICARWRKFELFYKDMGEPPTEKHELDRIDWRGNYTKENCRWATDKEQSRNRSSNRKISWRGQTKCLIEWAESTGMSRVTIAKRLRMGWSVGRALAFPVDKRKASLGNSRIRKAEKHHD